MLWLNLNVYYSKKRIIIINDVTFGNSIFYERLENTPIKHVVVGW